ncbi:MAG: hypothetical protein J2P28_02535 [Actinobacteria bacterium]|nr:hypothetical protein [Actinomycetota bacterium]MBO0834380.1 hypothetical protein [Actinomycetota bacterium]
MTRNMTRMALTAAAVILVAAGFWAGKSLTATSAVPTVQTGTVGLVGLNGDEFSIRLSGQRNLTSYGLPSDVIWRNAYGVWQDGTRPGCMPPLSKGQRISFGVINAAPVADAPGGTVVVWIACPSRPISRYPIVTPPVSPLP